MDSAQATFIKELIDSVVNNADKLTSLVIALALLVGFVAILLFLWKGTK